MAHYREQTLIDAPVDAVWQQVGDPSTYPRWAGDIVEVTGLDAVEEGAKYHQTTQTPFGKSESDFIVDRLEDLREIKVRCLLSGYYLHWQLTEAGDDTFTQVEVGMDPTRIGYHAVDKTVGRRWYRKVVEQTLARLRETIK